MALPPQQLPARGPRAPPALQMLRDFVLPESFCPRAFARLSRLLSRVLPFPVSWIPWTAWAPPDTQEPPAGLQRAPCEGFVEPQVSSTHWTSPNLPPADSSTLGYGAAALPGAALLGAGDCGSLPAWAATGTSQGPVEDLEPQSHWERGAEAPAAPVLPAPSPGNEHTEAVPAGIDIWSTATPVGTPPGSSSPAGSSNPCSPFADQHSQGLVDLDGDAEVTKEMLLREALQVFGLSQEMLDVIQDVPGDVPRPGDPGATKGKEGGEAAPVGVNFISGHDNNQRVSAESSIPGTDTSMGTALGSSSASECHVLSSPVTHPHYQGPGELTPISEYSREVEEAVRSLTIYEETEGVSQGGPIMSPPAYRVLSSPVAHPHYQGLGEQEFDILEYAWEVEEAVRSLGLYEEMEEGSQEGPGSSPMAGEPGGLGSSPPARAGIKRGGSHFPTPPTKRRAPPGEE